MSHRYVNIDKLKSKRKKNQYINELLSNCYQPLMITKKEFIKRHKKQVANIFEQQGYDRYTEMYVEDSLAAYYWYKDPLCYKTSLDNLDYFNFDKKFDTIFGESMKYNKDFLKKLRRLRNKTIL